MNKPWINGMNDAVRDNPLAAALVGAGVFWMLFGSKVPGLASAAPQAARVMGESLGSGAREAAEAVGRTADSVKRQVANTVERVSDAARDALGNADPAAVLDTASEASGKAMRTIHETVKDGQRHAGVVQQRLSESLERQPLLLGVLGVAIGAGIASTFASTRIEDEWMGVQGAAARETLQTAAEDAKAFAVDRGREVLDNVTREAQAQGLTAEDAKQGLQDIAGKVKAVAGVAREAVAGRVS